jgi:DNA invertase Pin-like site-specific DNA recombinase
MSSAGGFMHDSLVPAAQYLRMSTDYQQYSLDNQSDAIARYATLNGFTVVRTYSDAARSGLRLQNRSGLKQLLKNVVEGQSEFRVVLVYDVSRWGRFQDMDEAAHYEYLCKLAGVPVHYCAELFTNGNSVADRLLKALKRTMAGEYSRDLGEKVASGLFNVASLGYCTGGPPSYGFQRQLIDPTGMPKQLLNKGERKSISTDRVILVPGSREEIAIVRRIFQSFVNKGRSMPFIAQTLNRDGVPFVNGGKWSKAHVNRVLRNPRYCGTQVWGRTTGRLFAPVRRVDPQKWATRPGAFSPIVTKELFDDAQQRIANFACNLSDEQLIEKLRDVLRVNGKLSAEIIEASPLCPTARTYYERFGGLAHAYAKVGIHRPEMLSAITNRQRFTAIRKGVIASFLQQFPNELKEIHPVGFRSLLMDCKSGTWIGVKLACWRWNNQKGSYWLLECNNTQPKARDRATIVALLDEKGQIEQLRLFSNLNFLYRSIRFYKNEKWLQKSLRLGDISEFLSLLRNLPTPVNRRTAECEA